jgi:glycine/D-amino acid oxidase-like deaminating enzyme
MLLDLDEKSGFYMVPPVGRTPAKFGDHMPGRAARALNASDVTVSSASVGGRQAPDVTRQERDRLSTLFTSGFGRRLPHDTTFGLCHYGMTPDRRFLLRVMDPGVAVTDARLVVVGGGSGHGFKFGPLIGELVARVLDGSVGGDTAGRIASGRAPYRR